jgi:methyl-accepting chemotaxis protein
MSPPGKPGEVPADKRGDKTLEEALRRLAEDLKAQKASDEAAAAAGSEAAAAGKETAAKAEEIATGLGEVTASIEETKGAMETGAAKTGELVDGVRAFASSTTSAVLAVGAKADQTKADLQRLINKLQSAGIISG